jgi:hypothetical protein
LRWILREAEAGNSGNKMFAPTLLPFARNQEETMNKANVATALPHRDRMAFDTSPPSLSLSPSHPSPGCSVLALQTAGHFYGSAVN